MARSNELRPLVKLRSTAGTGYTYVTRKNRRTHPDRLVLRKYDPRLRHHVDFREERWMAKKSKIIKNEQRAVVVARYGARRAELKAAIKSQDTAYDERAAAVRACPASRATAAPSACATATRSTAVRVASSGRPG